jgi:hypothetical protein
MELDYISTFPRDDLPSSWVIPCGGGSSIPRKFYKCQFAILDLHLLDDLPLVGIVCVVDLVIKASLGDAWGPLISH